MGSTSHDAGFTGPAEYHTFPAMLFDLGKQNNLAKDGPTLLTRTQMGRLSIVPMTSSNSGTSHFPRLGRSGHGRSLTRSRLGKELGVDPLVVLQSSHGRRTIDTLQLYDPAKANWECWCSGERSGVGSASLKWF